MTIEIGELGEQICEKQPLQKKRLHENLNDRFPALYAEAHHILGHYMGFRAT